MTADAQIRATRTRAGNSGFTMIEIVVAIAIVAIVSGAAMLTLGTMSPERQLKRPAVKMKVFAREALSLARSTQRPHSIFMSPEFFVLRETHMRDEDLDDALDPEDKPQTFKVRDEDDEEEEPEMLRVVQRYDIEEGTEIQIKRLFDKEWKTPKKESWNFYTSGICDPIMIRFNTEDGFIEMEFNPLTAKVQPDAEIMEIFTEK